MGAERTGPCALARRVRECAAGGEHIFQGMPCSAFRRFARAAGVGRTVGQVAVGLALASAWQGCSGETSASRPPGDVGDVGDAAGGGDAPNASDEAPRASGDVTRTGGPALLGSTDVDACRARIDRVRAEPRLPGAPRFEAARLEVLGRARGEPMIFVREPLEVADDALDAAARSARAAFRAGKPGRRVADALRRHKGAPAVLRALALRDGYLFTEDPQDAFAWVSHARLTDLFGAEHPRIWLERAAETRELERVVRNRETSYRYADGPLAGTAADLLFGDRVATSRQALGAPLHRDLAELAHEVGFDRARVEHASELALVVALRFGADPAGAEWVDAVLERGEHPASLRLGCLAADGAQRARIEAFLATGATRRAALGRMRDTIGAQVRESLRFDRPEGETAPDRDGELRPVWMSAYLSGRSGFEVDGTSYPVFDAGGRATPPQVCVDFVVDTFERASGSWFRPRGEAPGRTAGTLRFGEAGFANHRGVLAFGDHAEELPALFEVRRFRGAERIAFRERSRFFAFLAEHADDVRAGDVVAIQGLKRDDRVHQHAILVERVDPLTGFPMGLADQMKRPRRRTWEGIMAEAPARSLLWRVRPTDAIWTKVAGQPAPR